MYRTYGQDHEAHSRFVLMEREAHSRRFARTGRMDRITKRMVASFSVTAKRTVGASLVLDVWTGPRSALSRFVLLSHEAHGSFVLMDCEARGRRFARTGRMDRITKRTFASFSWTTKRMGDASLVLDVRTGSRRARPLRSRLQSVGETLRLDMTYGLDHEARIVASLFWITKRA